MGVLAGKVASYYPRIDAADLDWVVRLFSADAVYDRADTSYRGAAEIERFFRQERKIRGRHRIEQLHEIPEERIVVALGHFDGVGAAGDDRSVAFADIWCFGPEDLVRRRRTFLALGSHYVRE